MATSKGTITFKDLFSNFSTMRFKGGADLAAVTTLKTALSAFSDCHIRAEGFQDKNYFAVVGAGNRDLKAIITLADADGETHKWAIPGFNGEPVQDSEGERVSDANVATIQAAIEAYTGETYTALRSPVIQTR